MKFVSDRPFADPETVAARKIDRKSLTWPV
jgi:hypothetical protein